MSSPKLYSVALPTPQLEGLEDFGGCGTDHFICFHPDKEFTHDEFDKLIRDIRNQSESQLDILTSLKSLGFEFIDVIEYNYVDDRTLTIGNRL